MLLLISLIAIWLSVFRVFGIKINFFHIILAYWTLQCIAVANITGSALDSAVLFFLLYIISCLAGASLYFYLRPYTQSLFVTRQFSRSPEFDKLSFGIFFVLVLMVTLYHYMVGGIPLFSSSLKIDAFNNTRSGFFGIPGRVANWGPIILVIIAIIYRHSFATERHRSRLLVYSSVALCLLSLIANGHKSALLVIAQVTILSIGYTRSCLTVAPQQFFRWLIYGLLVTLGVYLLAANILSGSTTNVEIVDRLIFRLLEVSGRPFEFVFNDYSLYVPPGYGAYLINDLQDVLSKVGFGYSGMNTSERVSFALHGGDLWNGTTVPTTINIFGRSIIEFGKLGTIVFAALFGASCAYLIRFGASRATVVGRVSIVLIQYAVFVLAVKGNPIYSISSMLFGVIFVGTLFVAARLTSMVLAR